MPAISEILDSVSIPSLIKDDLIKNGSFEKTSRGLKYYSGGFTIVFPVSTNNEKWAFRCWHSELGNVRKRFQIISNYVNNLKSPYFYDLFYCDEGIVVDGKTYPTTRMKWVEGEPLNMYVEKHVHDTASIKLLASSFLTMIDFLHEKKIAHGDLQHGNILVQNNDIKLVDYDSIFVPGLEGSFDIITGKADYQHPKRKNAHIATEKLDYFSELVIYLSIFSLAVKPELLKDFSIEDSMLFQSTDWNNFTNSKIYDALNAIDNDDIRLLLGILADYLKEDDINKLRPFTEIWRELVKKPIIHAFTCGTSDGIVYKNIETEISWDVENCSKIFLNGKEINPHVAVKKMKFPNDCKLELTAQNGIHAVSKILMVHVVNRPIITISAKKNKLKKTSKGIEITTLTWNVTDADSVSIISDGKTLSTQRQSSNFPITPEKDTIYKVVAIGLDKKTEFSESLNILVREPSNFIFESDKTFTLPGVPITITWKVQNAKAVKLNDNIVSLSGKTIFFPEIDTEFTLTIEDDFETITEKTKVRMLPMPVVNSILVDTPNIDITIGIKYNTPHFENIPNIPVIQTKFEQLKTPFIGDLKETGLFIDLPTPIKKKLSERISMFIKQIIRK